MVQEILPALQSPTTLTREDEKPALYVSTSLAYWETDSPRNLTEDVRTDDGIYRRLTPRYYVWLKRKVAVVRRAFVFGRFSKETFEGLQTRFEQIHTWAVEHLGVDILRTAELVMNPGDYNPPAATDFVSQESEGKFSSPNPTTSAPHQYPEDGHWPHTYGVSPEAVAKVDAIQDAALALGWKKDRLYQNRSRHSFPYGQEYGLVCYVDGAQSIGGVTREFIEIIGGASREGHLRFYNPDVEQPWIRKPRNSPDTLTGLPVGNKQGPCMHDE